MTEIVIPGAVVQGKKSPLHSGLPERLKEARKAAKVPLTRLSVSAGLSRATAANIEAGAVPRVDAVERMARVLGVSPCWLAFGDEGHLPWREKRPRSEREPALAAEARPPYGLATMSCTGIGARLQQARKGAGLGLRALGRAAGTSDTAVRLTEEGSTLPTIATVEALSRALDVSPGWLAYAEGVGPG